MDLFIRPVQDQDYDALTDIINRVEAPWQTTPQETQQEDRTIVEAGGTLRHFVAVKQETVVGHGVLRGAGTPEQRQPYQLELRVHPGWQQRGIGWRSWRCLCDDLEGMQPAAVRVWVRERYPDALAFAQRRGFMEIRRSGPWRLTLAGADLRPFQAAQERVAAHGTALITLAAEREQHPQCLSKLHQLRTLVDADIPASEPYPILSLEEFVRETESAGVLADGFFIAKRGEEYVGLSCLNRSSADPQELRQSVTGVRSDCRQQGIATALKACGIAFAEQQGYARIVTYVDSTNAPMTALNQKLGFVGGDDVVLMERRLSSNHR